MYDCPYGKSRYIIHYGRPVVAGASVNRPLSLLVEGERGWSSERSAEGWLEAPPVPGDATSL